MSAIPDLTGATLGDVEQGAVDRPTIEAAATAASGRPVEELRFRDDMVFYGVHELPVTW